MMIVNVNSGGGGTLTLTKRPRKKTGRCGHSRPTELIHTMNVKLDHVEDPPDDLRRHSRCQSVEDVDVSAPPASQPPSSIMQAHLRAGVLKYIYMQDSSQTHDAHD